MAVLGVSCGFHDASLTVLDGDQIKFAAHSERYSKHKHDKNLSPKLIEEALKYNITEVAYYETPWLKQMRCWYAGQGMDWKSTRLSHVLKNQFGPYYKEIEHLPKQYYRHHQSHAAAGFQTSKFDDATVVVVDAIGEFDCLTIWDAKYVNGKAQYKKVFTRRYPHSLGLFYSAMTERAGLKPLDEEYILMGMSAFGNPHLEKMDEIIDDKFDIRFKTNCHLGLLNWHPELTEIDVATSAQYEFQLLMQNVWKIARDKGSSDNLVYMGGCALNCVANEEIGLFFQNIWIMPNPGDAGSSLGAAALTYGGKVDWQHPYLGEEIKGEYPVNQVLETLLDTGICGVASGRAEFGPRALGNRSLLADPRSPGMKDRVNQIKRRQQFRPFGPAILSEQVENYYDMPVGWQDSPYMQVIARVQSGKKIMKGIEYPAVIHADGTTRVQTVDQHMNPGFRALLEKWFIITDCPILLNTSLNIRGEPMVNNRADADRFTQEYGVPVWS